MLSDVLHHQLHLAAALLDDGEAIFRRNERVVPQLRDDEPSASARRERRCPAARNTEQSPSSSSSVSKSVFGRKVMCSDMQ